MKRSLISRSAVLAHDLFGENVKNTAIFMHGIFGHKRNWRTGAQTWNKLHPQFQSVAVDLRGHGQSIHLAPPHTVAACANDIDHLISSTVKRTPDIVFAHSFGGKVAIKYVEEALQAGKPLPKDIWILDSIPFKYTMQQDATKKSQSVFYVFDVLRRMPRYFKSREWVVEELCYHGLEKPIALWLATNIVMDPKLDSDLKFRWCFELEVIEALFEDFCELDLSEFLNEFRETSSLDTCIHFLQAGANPGWTPSVLSDMKELTGTNVKLHTMPNVGHWLHTEDLHGMLSIITRESGLLPAN